MESFLLGSLLYAQCLKVVVVERVVGMVKDGDNVPQWLRNGESEFEYKFVSMVALLRSVEDYASLSAISRVTGINACQLSHYANGIKKPRLVVCKV